MRAADSGTAPEAGDASRTVLGPTLDNIKDSVFALGPDITLPVASKSTLFALVTIRYEWEVAAKTKTQGQTLMVFATFPLPSVKIQ